MSFVLLLGVAGCTATPAEPLLPGGSAAGLDAAAGDADVARLVRMAKRSLATGDAPTAQGLLEQALLNDPDHREAALTLGYVQLGAGVAQDAAASFGRILRRSADDREAGIGYARAMIAIGRSEAALEHLEPLIRRRADDAEALNLAGVAFDLQGEHDTAAEHYRRALAVAGDAAGIESNLGLSLALAGRHEAALAILEPLAEGYVSTARNRQNLALAYGLAGRFDAAERWSRMDLSEDDVANNLGFFRLLRGQAPGAVRSAALQPDFVRPVTEPPPQAARLGEAAAAPRAEPPQAAVPAAAGKAAPSIAGSAGAAATEAAPGAAPPATAAAIVATPPAAAGTLSPARRLPAALRPRQAFASADDGVTGVGVEVVSMGSWFVDLGPLPEPGWRAVRERHRELTSGLFRLARGKDASAPLIVGPFATAASADALCAALDDAVPSCTPVRL